MAVDTPSDGAPPAGEYVLAVNAGSSNVMFARFTPGGPPREALRGTLNRPGTPEAVLDVLAGQGALDRLVGIGHRVVHGGPDHAAPSRVTPELLRDLEVLKRLDPTHLPAELDLIAALATRCPGVPQVACFDTAFHRDLSAARVLPIPRRYQARGVRQYGFHGLSYEYLLEELARVAGAEAARGRVVLAHLGSGASLAAVHGGRCVDTTVGFTPTGGLVMGTRTGDLAPDVLFLLRAESLTADQFDRPVNRESGLLGVSETSADVRDLLAREASDPRAAEAITVFCQQARKAIGAIAAALGGLDTLVFAGGIGRARVQPLAGRPRRDEPLLHRRASSHRRPPRARRLRHGGAERASVPGVARGLPAHRPARVLQLLRGVHPHRRFDVQPAREVAEGVRPHPVTPAGGQPQLSAVVARVAAGSQRVQPPGPRLPRPRREQEGRGDPRVPAAGRELSPVRYRPLPAQPELRECGGGREAIGPAVADDGRGGHSWRISRRDGFVPRRGRRRPDPGRHGRARAGRPRGRPPMAPPPGHSL